MTNMSFYHVYLRALYIIVLTLHGIIMPHGFDRHTMIAMADNKGFMSIDHMANYMQQKEHDVASYDETTKRFVNNSVKATKVHQSNCYFIISFKQHNTSDIACTYAQQFYRVSDDVWLAAHKLEQGDMLLCGSNTTCQVASVTLINEPLEVYTIEVKNSHTFLVGRQGLVTHNNAIPMITMAGLSIPLSSGCGGTVGLPLGPIGVCGGIIIGGAIGYVINSCVNKKTIEYRMSLESDKTKETFLANDSGICSDAQAPGKPTENDGFIPKKKWDGKKVQNPNGGGWGWPDKKGNVWIPTGPNGHGCPHWDVQKPNGDYENILPGGKVRGAK